MRPLTRIPRPRTSITGAALIGIALSALVTSCSTTPRRVTVHYENGRRARAADDLDRALRELGMAIDLAEGSYVPALLARAETFLHAAAKEASVVEGERMVERAMEDLQTVLGEEDASLEERSLALHGLGHARLVRRENGRESELESELAASRFREVLDLLESPSVRDSRELQARYIDAHRQLGRLSLEDALSRRSLFEPPSPGNAQSEEDPFRPAQEHFSRCLEAAPADALCSLGKGICLHLRGQSGAAVPFLERGVRADVAVPWGGYKAHYFLARSLEEASGFQKQAIEHYRKALDADPSRTFLPLYRRLVAVLGAYHETPGDPSYETLLRRLLEYRGDEDSYWERIVELGTDLTSSTEPRVELLGYETLAVAHHRLEEFREAADSVAPLQNRPDFLELVDSLFVVEGEHLAQHAFARAQALFSAKRHAQLEEWFASGIAQRLASLLHSEKLGEEADYARRALIIRGKNLLSKWTEENGVESARAGEPPSADPGELAEAITMFHLCLSTGEKDREALLGLARAHEILGSYSEAVSCYRDLLARNSTDVVVFRKVRDLHGKAPEGEHKLAAWNLLQSYTGDDSDLARYMEETRQSIAAEVHRYCRHCGRRAEEEDPHCLECGRRFSSRAADQKGSVE